MHTTRLGWSKPAFGEVAAWLHAEGIEQREVDVRVEHTFRPGGWGCRSQRGRELNEHQRAEEQGTCNASGHEVWFC